MNIVSYELPTDDNSFYKWIENAYTLPSNLWLPKIDVKAIVTSFANEQGWHLYDASQMFNVLCRDASKVDTAQMLISKRSIEKQDTLHLVCMSEYNVEAMQMCDILFQMKDVSNGVTDVIWVDKYLLHAFCVFRGEIIRFYDVKDATLVRSILTQIENDAECMICFRELYNISTALPFACGHPICLECNNKISMNNCAKCRLSTRWKSQHYIKLNEEVKSAAKAGKIIKYVK